MKKQFSLLLLMSVVICLSGCASFAGGGSMPALKVAEDEIEGLSEKPFDQSWTVTKAILAEMGIIMVQDRPSGLIEARIAGSDVRALLEKATESAVRIRIKAREGSSPDLRLAQRIYARVAKALR